MKQIDFVLTFLCSQFLEWSRNTKNSSVCFFSRDFTVVSLKDSFSEMNFNVTSNNDLVNAGDNELVNLAPFAFLSDCKLTTTRGKFLKCTEYAHILRSVYNWKTNSENNHVLTIELDRSDPRRKQELTLNGEATSRGRIGLGISFKSFG